MLELGAPESICFWLPSPCYKTFRSICRFPHWAFFFTDVNNSKALLVVRDVILGSLLLYWDANSKEVKGIKFNISFERFPKKKWLQLLLFQRVSCSVRQSQRVTLHYYTNLSTKLKPFSLLFSAELQNWCVLFYF